MLVVRGLRKSYKAGGRGQEIVALDGVDLAAAAGAFVTVLGPSGSGKTTLLRCIAGFETPDDGTITVAGRAVVSARSGAPAHARGVGIVPQEGALFPHLNVAQNVGFGLRGSSRASRRERVGELLDLVGLGGMAERRPHQLSGGQQQRVALARALAPGPRLILLDEPFSALDAQLRTDLREEVRDLLGRLETTAVLVTHDQAEAMALADHLVVMRAGRVVAGGDPRDVYAMPADLQVGRFLGEAAVVAGQIDHASDGGDTGDGDIAVRCIFGRLEVVRWHGAVGACQVLIRPEHLTVTDTDVPAGDAVTGWVSGQSFFGHDTLLHVTIPQLGEPVSVRETGHRRHRVGERVSVAVTGPVCTYP